MTAIINHSISFKEDKLQVSKINPNKIVTNALIKTSKPKLESVSLNKKLFFLWKSLG